MANLNKVMLIGRLASDIESRTFSNGGKVAKFRFAVNNRRKNRDSGQWEDEPVFLDVEVFNRGEFGKQADLAEQYLAKGKQVFIEGHLRLDQWEKDGQKRSKLLVVADNFQFLEPREGGEGGGGSYGEPRRATSHQEPVYANGGNGGGGYSGPPDAGGPGGGDDDIPF